MSPAHPGVSETAISARKDKRVDGARTERSMSDPALAGRLATLEIPTLVLWGDSDRIADPGYGRAYAAAIPGARFRLLAGTGHQPQMETPGLVLDALWNETPPANPGPTS
jgi:pimeloyl-ACP methyl ester carboxylesterase